jgi:hypothetical protein
LNGNDGASAAELLADWRAAGRDTTAAMHLARIAEVALEAATAVEAAALAVSKAADAARQAAEYSRVATISAYRAAELAAEGAQLAKATAEGDRVRAHQGLDRARQHETWAEERMRAPDGTPDQGSPSDMPRDLGVPET